MSRRHRQSDTHVVGFSCCIGCALLLVHRCVRSAAVKTTGAFGGGRGESGGCCGRCVNHMMITVFALYLIVSTSGELIRPTSVLKERRQCIAAGEQYLNGTERTITKPVVGVQPSSDMLQLSSGIVVRRRRAEIYSVASDEPVIPVRLRTHRTLAFGARRRIRSGNRSTIGTVHYSPSHESDRRPVPTSGRSTLARISLDFERSIGDRLLGIDDEVTNVGTPLRQLTAVDPSVIGDLSLGACRIQTLSHRLLNGMFRLERLALWANEIDRIPAGLFDDTIRLRELLLWNNRLERLDVASLLPSYASIVASSGAVAPNSSLQILDLDRNQISKIGPPPPGRNGGGSNIDDHWHRFSALRTLRLSGNRITSIVAGSFRGLSSLQSLTLDGNGLAYIHLDSFAGLPSLVRLSLGDNVIAFVPDGLFASLGRLVELNLARNRIEHVWSKTFAGLRSLRRLDLTGNRLSQVPDDTFGPSTTPQLASLLLDDNRLRTLRRCVFPPPRSGRLLTVERRPQSDDGIDPPLPFPVQSLNVAPRRTLSLIGNSEMLCDCRLTWLARVVESGALRTIWGSCDVHQLHMGSVAASPAASDTSMPSSSRLPVHHHALSSFASTMPPRSPIHAAILRGFFDACPTTAECRT